MKCTHVCAAQLYLIINSTWFPFLADEIAEPRQDINIKVSAFTESKTFYILYMCRPAHGILINVLIMYMYSKSLCIFRSVHESINTPGHVLLNLLNSLRKCDNCSAGLAFYLIFQGHLLNELNNTWYTWCFLSLPGWSLCAHVYHWHTCSTLYNYWFKWGRHKDLSTQKKW